MNISINQLSILLNLSKTNIFVKIFEKIALCAIKLWDISYKPLKNQNFIFVYPNKHYI